MYEINTMSTIDISYRTDYDAPLSEAGDVTEKYTRAREIIQKYSGDSIKCYSCASYKHGEEKCGENSNLRPTDTDFIMECDVSCKLGYIDNVATGKRVYGRTCGKTPVQDCKRQELKRNHTGEFCQCKSNFCNLNWDIQSSDYEPLGLEVRNSAVISTYLYTNSLLVSVVVAVFLSSFV
ncbi:hypothetical protein FSP39_010522 [Pinctada imbricata]|uniref:Uncharacterized protein n=1 Tax=Pinctada imbricata TaxID=66713 RepID=A0AA89C5Z2_PINIB|nr:hypothetical protein FSP39_010522 [Pinctada imbricata]